MTTASDPPARERSTRLLLLASVFAIATCGLVYELIAGTLASYLLGDSVTQFSTVIGVYLFAMGVGSWLSRYVTRALLAAFVEIELLIGLVGGWSAALLFLLFESAGSFRVVLYGIVFTVGALVGMEIPLLLRLLKDRLEFRDLVSRVLSLDYVGALLASLLFPLVLVPHLGLMRSSFFFGFLNALVGVATLLMLRREIGWWRGLLGQGLAVLSAIAGGFVFADVLTAASEGRYYSGEEVVLGRSTPYQRIVLTRHRDDLRLYLNGNLQFSSRDEYRYHESLVHPLMCRLAKPSRILVLGGGDGLAVREILRHAQASSVTLVELDPAMTRLFATQPMLTSLNGGALSSARVHIVNADAFSWLETNRKAFDAVIIDFPDPTTFSLGKLYTTSFYRRLMNSLSPEALIAVQTTSPLVARRSFWCVDATLRACGLRTVPYHCYVPSFGEWGFILASAQPPPPADHLPEGLRFYSEAVFAGECDFPPDMARLEAEVNKLNNQVLVRLFEQEWGRL